MLNPHDQAMVREFAERVRKDYPTADVIAFGSRARGDHHEDSDLVVCVLLEQHQTADADRSFELAWEVCCCRHPLMTTIVMSKARFEIERNPAYFLIRNIKSEGIPA